MLSNFISKYNSQPTERDRTQSLISALSEQEVTYSDVLTLGQQLGEQQKIALIGTFAPYSQLLKTGTGYLQALPELLHPKPLSYLIEGLKKVILFLSIFWLLPFCQADCNQAPSQLLKIQIDKNILSDTLANLKRDLNSLDDLKTFKVSQNCSQPKLIENMHVDNYTDITSPRYVNFTWSIDTTPSNSYMFYTKSKSCFYAFKPKLENVLLHLKRASTGTINQAFGNCLSFAAPENSEPLQTLESKLHIFSCYESCVSNPRCRSFHYSHLDSLCRLYPNPQSAAKSINPQLISANISCQPFYIGNEPKIMFSSKLISARSRCEYAKFPKEKVYYRCMDDYSYLSTKTKNQITSIERYGDYLLSIFNNKDKRSLEKRWPSTLDIFQFINSRKMPLFLKNAGKFFNMVSKNQELVNGMFSRLQSRVLSSRPQHFRNLNGLTLRNMINGSQISTEILKSHSCSSLPTITSTDYHPDTPEQATLILDFYFFECEIQEFIQYLLLAIIIVSLAISYTIKRCCHKTDQNGNTYQSANIEEDSSATPGFWASLKFDGPCQLPPPPTDL